MEYAINGFSCLQISKEFFSVKEAVKFVANLDVQDFEKVKALTSLNFLHRK